MEQDIDAVHREPIDPLTKIAAQRDHARDLWRDRG
jgi:hypothetical protein